MIKALLKSFAAAVIFGFVVAMTWQMAIMIWAVKRFHSQVGVDFVHISRSPLIVALCGIAFIVTFASCFCLFRRDKVMPTPLLASFFGFGVFGAIALAILSSLSRQPLTAPIPIMAVIAFFSSYVAVIGFYGGLLGGSWLRLRMKHIRSMLRLILESACIGIFLGGLFTLLVVSPNGYGARSDVSPHTLVILAPLLFCATVGCVISIAFALIFRRRLITTPG